MVRNDVLLGLDLFDILKENGDDLKEILKDLMMIMLLIMKLCVHIGMIITRIIKHSYYNYVENQGENSSFGKKSIDESEINENIDVNGTCGHEDIDYIRFTSNGPIFQISKSVLDSLKGSFIDEQRNEKCRANDGSIYLDYFGKDVFVYYVLDYLNGNKVDFDSFCYEEQLELLDLIEFCNLPLFAELLFIRERRDTKKKKYEEGDEIELIINGNKNDTIKEYLVKNGLWNNYVKNYDNGFIDYNHIDDSLYMNKKYEYIEYITQYINNGTIDIEEDKIITINNELLEKEMVEIFGEKGREEVKEETEERLKRFTSSIILDKRYLETPLVNWLGTEKKWKLLFRASEHEYKASEFHKYCDNKGETVTLIKHIGNNNHINIFGGYTDQDWESPREKTYKSYSKEFLFTLSNEHGIPPTQYDHVSKGNKYGITLRDSYGPVFGGGCDIYIGDNCHHIPNDNATSNNSSYCKAQSYTIINTPQKGSLFTNTSNNNEYYDFIVEDYEVWGRE
ncbi:hypothetical protein WA158_007890 [Blastocystis sp. Blastoise]